MNITNAQQMHNSTKEPTVRNHSKKDKRRESSVSRTDIRYWMKRVEKLNPRPGYESPFYSVQIAYKGRRVRFPLETPVLSQAAEKAKKIYLLLLTSGWDVTLDKYKPQAVRPSDVATVGDLIEAVGADTVLRRSTFDGYCIALRLIVSQIENIEDQPKLDDAGKPCKDEHGKVILQSRFDYRTGGRNAWVKKVNAVPLDALTPDRIQQWRLAYLAKAGSAPDARKKATNSLNSNLRNARGLFSQKALQFVKDKITLPDPLPFAGIKLETKPPTRYISRIDARKLISDAKAELATDPARSEEFKLFCLFLLCGLRRREADSLLWRQVDFEKKHLRIETTEYFQPKSEDSHAAIDLNDSMLTLLQAWQSQATGEFVVESSNPPRYFTHRTNYRCKRHLDNLTTWLRGKNVNAQKPLHELRKELGATLATELGIFAAQCVLRHADIRITSQYYADKKGRITSSLGDCI